MNTANLRLVKTASGRTRAREVKTHIHAIPVPGRVKHGPKSQFRPGVAAARLHVTSAGLYVPSVVNSRVFHTSTVARSMLSGT